MRFVYIMSLFIVSILSSCEELIDVSLNEAEPKYVIVADLISTNLVNDIYVSKTVPFNSEKSSEPVDDALVYVFGPDGGYVQFNNIGNGQYRVWDPSASSAPGGSFLAIRNGEYRLVVQTESDFFEAKTIVTDYIDIDSLGTVEETIFNEKYYFVQMKFTDPKDEPNYYKYLISVNGGPYSFAAAYNDKFNDGLSVSHQISNKDNSLEVDDNVNIIRQVISKEVFNYWNEFQMLNPGTAAPANPTSNISNGALGYFSVSKAKAYDIQISRPRIIEEEEDNESGSE